MPRHSSTTKKTVQRERANKRLGFEEPIPMKEPQGAPLGVVGMINLYNRFAAEMQEYNSATNTPKDDSGSRSDIAYFNY